MQMESGCGKKGGVSTSRGVAEWRSSISEWTLGDAKPRETCHGRASRLEVVIPCCPEGFYRHSIRSRSEEQGWIAPGPAEKALGD